MHSVRRLYLYAMSGIGLAVLAVGAGQLLIVLLGQLGLSRGPYDGGSGYAEQLSLALALIGVGTPVWAVHWWLAERGLRDGRPSAAEERGSALRALYLTIVLAVLLGVGASAAVSLLRIVAGGILGGVGTAYGDEDVAAELAMLIVAGIGWGYHVWVRRRDMKVTPMAGAAAWLPRLYLYGAALLALGATLQAFGDLVSLLAEGTSPTDPFQGNPFGDPGYRTYQIANLVSLLLVWGVVWLGHWQYAGALTRDRGWRGESERPAELRVAFLVAVAIVAAVSVLRLGADALQAIIAVPIGELADAPPAARAVAVGLISAVPWAAAWWAHMRRLHDESKGDQPRGATAIRLDDYAVGAVGLAFAAVGLAWLIGLLIDVVLGGNRTTGPDASWQADLPTYASDAILGLAAWIWRWRRALARQATDPLGEAGSTVRRSYLMLALGAGIVGGLASLAVVLYRLLGSLLGAYLGGNPVSELSTPLGILVVAAGLAVYHGLAVRHDMALRAGSEPTAGDLPAAHRSLTLEGPAGSDLDGVVASLRSQLPEGYRLDDG